MLCCCSVSKSRPTLCDPTDCSKPGLSVPHHLLKFAQVHVHWIGDTIQPFYPVTHFSSCPQSFPVPQLFPMSWLFSSGGQIIGASASASASVFPMSIQGWFHLRLTGLIFLLSKGLSRVFSSTGIQRHQIFGTQPSLWSNSHICTWLLERIDYADFCWKSDVFAF